MTESTRPEMSSLAQQINHLHCIIFNMLDSHMDLRTDAEKASAWENLVEVRKRAVAIIDGVGTE